jgi:prepilin-type N-terminal cleavage/methylation domain-containing protein
MEALTQRMLDEACASDRRSLVNGFTLVELLVVVAIVAILSTLVAPAAYRQVERARGQAEWASIKRELESVSKAAFFRSDRVKIEFDGATVRFSYSTGDRREHKLRHVFFESGQTVWVNTNGVATPNNVNGWVSGAPRRITMNQWLLEGS